MQIFCNLFLYCLISLRFLSAPVITNYDLRHSNCLLGCFQQHDEQPSIKTNNLVPLYVFDWWQWKIHFIFNMWNCSKLQLIKYNFHIPGSINQAEREVRRLSCPSLPFPNNFSCTVSFFIYGIGPPICFTYILAIAWGLINPVSSTQILCILFRVGLDVI